MSKNKKKEGFKIGQNEQTKAVVYLTSHPFDPASICISLCKVG
ncbi:hypothetical protein RU95_GL000599 [Enterococcus avium]|nr:hypothetical protein RU95_GL000599 [Enterococcus avium]